LALLIVACGPASTPTRAPAIEETEEPVLSNNLKRDCQFTPFNNADLVVGEIAVNFTLKDIHASEFSLSQLLAEKPVLMIFGSFT
jgi:hypothetical protein